MLCFFGGDFVLVGCCFCLYFLVLGWGIFIFCLFLFGVVVLDLGFGSKEIGEDLGVFGRGLGIGRWEVKG